MIELNKSYLIKTLLHNDVFDSRLMSSRLRMCRCRAAVIVKKKLPRRCRAAMKVKKKLPRRCRDCIIKFATAPLPRRGGHLCSYIKMRRENLK